MNVVKKISNWDGTKIGKTAIFAISLAYIVMFNFSELVAQLKNSGYVYIDFFWILLAVAGIWMVFSFAVTFSMDFYDNYSPRELTEFIAAKLVLLSLLFYFGYSRMDSEISVTGYEAVAAMTSKSVATAEHYKTLQEYGVLTIQDLAELLETYSAYADEAQLQKEMLRADEAFLAKVAAREALLKAHSDKEPDSFSGGESK